MSEALYRQVLEVNIGFWRQEMRRDKNDFLLAVTERESGVALLLLDKKGKQFANGHDRRELRRR